MALRPRFFPRGRRALLTLARCESGMTLTELLTTMAILSVVLSGLGALFVSGSNAQVDLNRRFQAQNEARISLDRLRRDGHCAHIAVVRNGAGTAVIDPTAGVKVTFTFEAGCPGGTGDLSYCTVGSGQRYALYRQSGSTCGSASPAVKFGDYLTRGDIFTYQAQSPQTLARLRVNLPVDLTPLDTAAGYALVDDVVLRNSDRNFPS